MLPLTPFLSLLSLAIQQAQETKDKKLCRGTIKIVEDLLSDLERARFALPADAACALNNAYDDLIELRAALDFT